jgi:NADH-quinone oxidoreductase subunit M
MLDNFTGFVLLNVLIYLPLVVAVVCAFWPQLEQVKWVAAIGAGLTLVLSVVMLALYPFGAASAVPEAMFNVQWFERYEWLSGLGVNYTMGVDGVSMLLLVLTTLLSTISILVSFTAITRRQREYYIWLLILQTGMMGVFVSLDFFVFYIFWEVMLVPMAILIGIWGSANRVYAAIKFFLYTLAGSVLMLVAIIALYIYSGQHGQGYTLDVLTLQRLGANGFFPPDFQIWVFLAFAAAFAIKVPMFPFHTWLPDAHVQAPTAGSIILAGVLLKMGGYGFIRFAIPITPNGAQTMADLMIALSVIGIIYGAWVSIIQPDLKKLIAYSSVSHMGFVTLGLFSAVALSRTGQATQGIDGAVVVMLSHGLLTGGLFLCVGVIYERLHSREISAMGGLTARMPVFAALFGIIMMGSAGLPGLSGFVGEYLVLQGTFRGVDLWWVVAIATTVRIFAAIYLLWMFQRVMFERPKPNSVRFPEVNWREGVSLAVLAGLSLAFGFFPTPVIDFISSTDQALLHTLGRAAADAPTISQFLGTIFR